MMHRILALISLLLLLGGCSVDSGAPIDEAAWKSELLEHRERKDEEFRISTTSPSFGSWVERPSGVSISSA